MKQAQSGRPKQQKKTPFEAGPDGKFKPTYDASENNPFNTMDKAGYEYWKNKNTEGRFATNPSDSPFKQGNHFSRENPMQFGPMGLNTDKYGPVQPIFDPPRRADFGRDRKTMEAVARDYTYNTTSVDLTKSRIPDHGM